MEELHGKVYINVNIGLPLTIYTILLRNTILCTNLYVFNSLIPLCMSIVVSLRLPRELAEILGREAKARGVSLSALLKEIVEKALNVKQGEPLKESFTLKLEKTLNVLGEAKMEACQIKENCPLKPYGLDPSPITCALCQIHDHMLGLLPTSTYNPYQHS